VGSQIWFAINQARSTIFLAKSFLNFRKLVVRPINDCHDFL
jgi:hypothetical protein